MTFLCLHGRRVTEPAVEHPKGPIMAQGVCSLFYWLDFFTVVVSHPDLLKMSGHIKHLNK